jgi:hypothetical protein
MVEANLRIMPQLDANLHTETPGSPQIEPHKSSLVTEQRKKDQGQLNWNC